MAACCFVDGIRKPGMIEGNLLRRGIGVHDHELRAALYCVGIPETVDFTNPVSWAGHVDHKVPRLLLQVMGSLIIGERSLRVQTGYE